MNMRDDIELTVLAEYGDVDLAERVGFTIDIDCVWQSLCAVIGIPEEALRVDLS